MYGMTEINDVGIAIEWVQRHSTCGEDYARSIVLKAFDKLARNRCRNPEITFIVLFEVHLYHGSPSIVSFNIASPKCKRNLEFMTHMEDFYVEKKRRIQ